MAISGSFLPPFFFFFLTLRPYCFFFLICFPCGPFKKSLLNLLQCFCKRFGLFYPQACEILTTPPGVEPVSPHPCINHWPTREVPILLFEFKCSTCFVPIYFVSVVLQSSLGVFHPPSPGCQQLCGGRGDKQNTTNLTLIIPLFQAPSKERRPVNWTGRRAADLRNY